MNADSATIKSKVALGNVAIVQDTAVAVGIGFTIQQMATSLVCWELMKSWLAALS